MGLLFYSAHATNDGIATLGGQPFDNPQRLYIGSDNDLLLNRKVKRIQADAAALAEIEAHYQTSGQLESDLVTMHTTGDPIVLYWQEAIYGAKTLQNSPLFTHINIPVFRYGHCNFEVDEVFLGFLILVLKVELSGE